MKLRTLGLAAAIATLPFAAQAGQLEISGGLVDLETINVEDNGNLDFIINDADVDFASGSFGFLQDTDVTFNSLSFIPGEVIYFGDSGLSFTAQNFGDYDNTAPDWSFMASGLLELDGFEATPGVFAFTTQRTRDGQTVSSFSSSTTATPIPLPASVMLLFGALAGLGLLGQRRRAA